jgi:catechol 2,3-dioxygenase-like lactoylglutathione lyase family enzyme
MLAAGKLVGFVPTTDSTRSREFYEDKLGFQFVSDDPFALVMQAGESTIRIAKAANFAPAPVHGDGLGGHRYSGDGEMAQRTRSRV